MQPMRQSTFDKQDQATLRQDPIMTLHKDIIGMFF